MAATSDNLIENPPFPDGAEFRYIDHRESKLLSPEKETLSPTRPLRSPLDQENKFGENEVEITESVESFETSLKDIANASGHSDSGLDSSNGSEESSGGKFVERQESHVSVEEPDSIKSPVKLVNSLFEFVDESESLDAMNNNSEMNVQVSQLNEPVKQEQVISECYLGMEIDLHEKTDKTKVDSIANTVTENKSKEVDVPDAAQDAVEMNLYWYNSNLDLDPSELETFKNSENGTFASRAQVQVGDNYYKDKLDDNKKAIESADRPDMQEISVERKETREKWSPAFESASSRFLDLASEMKSDSRPKNSIAVPTDRKDNESQKQHPWGLDDDKVMIMPEDNVEDELPTVSPLASELKDMAVGGIDLDLPEVCDDTDEMNADLPEVHDDSEEIDADLPEVCDDSDEIDADLPEVCDDSDDVDADLPEVCDDSDEEDADLPEVCDDSDEIDADLPEVCDDSDEVDADVPEADDDIDETDATGYMALKDKENIIKGLNVIDAENKQNTADTSSVQTVKTSVDTDKQTDENLKLESEQIVSTVVQKVHSQMMKSSNDFRSDESYAVNKGDYQDIVDGSDTGRSMKESIECTIAQTVEYSVAVTAEIESVEKKDKPDWSELGDHTKNVESTALQNTGYFEDITATAQSNKEKNIIDDSELGGVVKEEIAFTSAQMVEYSPKDHTSETAFREEVCEPIEVRRKFRLVADVEEKLTRLGATLMEVENYIDEYLDDENYSLCLNDCWLRLRNKKFEMKVNEPLEGSSKSAVYNEIKNEKQVEQYLVQKYGGKLYDRQQDQDLPLDVIVDRLGFTEFATFETVKKSYTLNTCIVELELTDFGLQVCELEAVADRPSKVIEALDAIKTIAVDLDLQPLQGV